MTETPSTAPESVPDMDLANRIAEYDKSYAQQLARREQIMPINKATLFDALAAAGITTVIVKFDGSGDSGQIENIEAQNGDDPVTIPDRAIEFLNAVWCEPEIAHDDCTIRDAIEEMAYEFLRQTHDGWENEDGAHGEFAFDVETRTITLDYNERYISSENYTHEF